MRPGVEIVRGRALQAPQVEKLEQGALLALTYHEREDSPPPVIKQLRFDSPIQTLTHKYSDLSLAGSMIVQTGDAVSVLESEYDEDESDMSMTASEISYGEESESESDDDESWVDEGFAEPEDTAVVKASKVVRFADKPLPSPRPMMVLPRNVSTTSLKRIGTNRNGC